MNLRGFAQFCEATKPDDDDDDISLMVTVPDLHRILVPVEKLVRAKFPAGTEYENHANSFRALVDVPVQHLKGLSFEVYFNGVYPAPSLIMFDIMLSPMWRIDDKKLCKSIYEHGLQSKDEKFSQLFKGGVSHTIIKKSALAEEPKATVDWFEDSWKEYGMDDLIQGRLNDDQILALGKDYLVHLWYTLVGGKHDAEVYQDIQGFSPKAKKILTPFVQGFKDPKLQLAFAGEDDDHDLPD